MILKRKNNLPLIKKNESKLFSDRSVHFKSKRFQVKYLTKFRFYML